MSTTGFGSKICEPVKPSRRTDIAGDYGGDDEGANYLNRLPPNGAEPREIASTPIVSEMSRKPCSTGLGSTHNRGSSMGRISSSHFRALVQIDKHHVLGRVRCFAVIIRCGNLNLRSIRSLKSSGQISGAGWLRETICVVDLSPITD